MTGPARQTDILETLAFFVIDRRLREAIISVNVALTACTRPHIPVVLSLRLMTLVAERLVIKQFPRVPVDPPVGAAPPNPNSGRPQAASLTINILRFVPCVAALLLVR